MTIQREHAWDLDAARLSARESPVEKRPHHRRLAGLDGLRALAVLAVVCFHLNPAWLPGGFLGVDVFFVISGFLITSLCLTEVARTGRLDVWAFYARRFRRLMPAAFALIGVVAVISWVIWTDEWAAFKSSIAASLTYVTNWWLILDDQSYFAMSGRPPMLQHLWSLAIEEQYYLIWPAVLILVTGLLAGDRRRRFRLRARAVMWVAFALALLSAGWMATLAMLSGVPYLTDSSRVYFGTDTHAFGLFLGSAGGAWAAVRATRPGRMQSWPWLTDLLAFGGLALMLAQFRQLDEFSEGLYRGGFFLFDLLVLAVIWFVTRRGSWTGRVLDAPPLRWVGERSYSIYLWHWPVVVVTRPDLDVWGPAWLVNGLRFALILVLAELSYRFVEQPFRSRRTVGAADLPRQRTGVPTPKLPVSTPAALAAVSALCVAALVVCTWIAKPDGVGASMAALNPAVESADPVVPDIPDVPSGRAGQGAQGREPPAGDPSAAPSTSPRSGRGGQADAPTAMAFGDSVLLGAASALESSKLGVAVDAAEGARSADVLQEIVVAAEADALSPTVIIHTGTNGVIDPAQLRSTLEALADRDQVLVMTVRVARSWQDPNNATLREVSADFDNVELVDWYAITAEHPSWLYGDGIHLTRDGAEGYSGVVLSAVRAGSDPPP